MARLHRWLGVAAAVALAACGAGSSEPVVEGEAVEVPADQVILGVEHYITVDGVRRALLRADTAYFYHDSARVDLRVVRLQLYNEQGEEAANLTSDRGRHFTRTQRMVARGNVVLVTREENRRIETEELFYDPRADRIWSDVETRLYEDGSVVRGDGFTADGRLQNLKVTRPSGRFEGLELEF